MENINAVWFPKLFRNLCREDYQNLQSRRISNSEDFPLGFNNNALCRPSKNENLLFSAPKGKTKNSVRNRALSIKDYMETKNNNNPFVTNEYAIDSKMIRASIHRNMWKTISSPVPFPLYLPADTHRLCIRSGAMCGGWSSLSLSVSACKSHVMSLQKKLTVHTKHSRTVNKTNYRICKELLFQGKTDKHQV